jgi:hypothetical protein
MYQIKSNRNVKFNMLNDALRKYIKLDQFDVSNSLIRLALDNTTA